MATSNRELARSELHDPGPVPDEPLHPYGENPGDRADMAQRRRAAKHADAGYGDAYERGKRGEALDDDADEPTRQAHAAGVEERSSASAPPRSGAPGRRPPNKPKGGSSPLRSLGNVATGKKADTAGGFVLGLLGYALVLSFIREGPHGPVRWLSAKFLNKPLPDTSSGTSPVSLPPVNGNPPPKGTFANTNPATGQPSSGGL